MQWQEENNDGKKCNNSSAHHELVYSIGVLISQKSEMFQFWYIENLFQQPLPEILSQNIFGHQVFSKVPGSSNHFSSLNEN